MRNIILIGIFGLLFLGSCREDVNETDIEVITEEVEVNVVGRVMGKIVDESGNPMSSAQIQAGNEIVYTDANGEFETEETILRQGSGQIIIKKNGYFTQVSKVTSRADDTSYEKVTLLERGAGQELNASQGADLVTADGLRLSFPPNSLKTANGTPYNGTAKVYSKILDPTDGDFSEQMTAQLVAKTLGSEVKNLKPYLIINLELEGENGEELGIKDDVIVEMDFPIPDELENELGGDEVPSWHYDLEEEFWLEDVACYPSSIGYSCGVATTGSWCCCLPLDGVEVQLKVINADTTPAAFVKVEYDDNGSYFNFGGYTTSQGYIRGTLPENTDFQLLIEDLCANIVYNQEVGPYASATVMPDIWLDSTVEQFDINVQGTLLDCNMQAVSNGWINVRYPNYEKTFAVETDGSFDFNVYFNCIDFPDMEIKGYDGNGEMQSISLFHNQLSDVNTGDISTCNAISSGFNFITDTENLKMFPAYYNEVWSEPHDMEIKADIPGGEILVKINNYNGPAAYVANVTIINHNGIAPDYSNIEGTLIDTNVLISSDDGTFMEGDINGFLTNGIDEININFTAQKKL